MPPKLEFFCFPTFKKTDFPRSCEACYMYWHSRYISEAIHISSWSKPSHSNHTTITNFCHKSSQVWLCPIDFPTPPVSAAEFRRVPEVIHIVRSPENRIRAPQGRAESNQGIRWSKRAGHSKMASSTAIQPWSWKGVNNHLQVKLFVEMMKCWNRLNSTSILHQTPFWGWKMM